jgi:hypothetical protein
MTDVQSGVSDAEKEIEEAVTAIRAAYSGWTDAEARTNEACYLLLAEIFVRAPSIEADITKKTLLVREVRKHPDVGMSNRYDPFKSTAAELMLTLLFGLRQQRNTKSHWRAALQAADQECERGTLARTRDEFVAWIRRVTIHGARANVAKPRTKFDPATLEQFIHEEAVELPFPLPDDLDAPSGYALVVVKIGEASEGKRPTAAYCGCISNPQLLESARRALQRQRDQECKRVAEEWVHESGDPKLLIPKSERSQFGRTHFTDDDERDDHLAEKKYLTRETRRRLRGKPKSQQELAKRKKGQAALPVEENAVPGPIEAEPSSATGVQPTATEPEEAEIDYFAAMRERPDL